MSKETEVKKDVEWLKEKVKGEYEYNRARHNKEGFEGYAHREFVFKYVLGLLEQLDEPEVLSQELPVIPQWVADNIESKKRVGTRLNVAMSEFPEYKLEKELDIDEYECNEVYARAWLDGYTVEEEQKYRIELPNSEHGIVYIAMDVVTGNPITRVEIHNGDYKTDLTEEEIKNMDERFMAFAEPVERTDSND